MATANELLSKPRPINWTDDDELTYRIAVESIARQERDPHGYLGSLTFPEWQQDQLENREMIHQMGREGFQKHMKEIEEENMQNLIIDSLLKKR